jgi:hypothetical protein
MSKYAIVKTGNLVGVAEHMGEALRLQQELGGIIIEGEYSPHAAKSYIVEEWAQLNGCKVQHIPLAELSSEDLIGSINTVSRLVEERD